MPIHRFLFIIGWVDYLVSLSSKLSQNRFHFYNVPQFIQLILGLTHLLHVSRGSLLGLGQWLLQGGDGFIRLWREHWSSNPSDIGFCSMQREKCSVKINPKRSEGSSLGRKHHWGDVLQIIIEYSWMKMMCIWQSINYTFIMKTYSKCHKNVHF